MSQSESPLRASAVIVNIVTPAHTERQRPCLAELADHAFSLADQQAGGDPNNIPSGIFTRNIQARILYSVKHRVGPIPIKVILYQDVPAGQIQRVVVNFQTEIVQCEGKPSLPIETWRIELAQEEIKPYIRKSLKILRVMWREISNEARCSAWQDFSERLKLNDVSSAQSQVCADSESSLFEKACPSCDVSMTLCTSCHAAICLSWDCPASRLIPSQSCSRHTYVTTCLPCLQTSKTIPPLGQCPECNLWFCDRDLAWCLGRLEETPNQASSNTVSTRVREHPAKPIACFYCDRDQAVSECSNQNCWSRAGNVKNPRICQSCSPAGGISCACEDDWICDNCKEPPMADCLKQCPRCKRAYCVSECAYIQFCAECGRTTLCDDCVEEDLCSFAARLDGPEVQEVELVGVCQTDSCSKKLCEECLEEWKCAGCNQTHCSPCLQYVQCSSCHLPSNFCGKCLDERRCSGCDKTYCSSCMPSELCTSCPGRDYEPRGGMRWRVPLMRSLGQGNHEMWVYL